MVFEPVQVFLVHGGMTFRSKKDYLHFLRTREVSIHKRTFWSGVPLDKALGSGFEVIRPRMPLQDDAKYIEWKMHFERFFPLLRDGIILIGSSLGGIFLAKYLSENRFPRNILSTYLVCPPFDDSLPGEDLTGGFELGSDLSLMENQSPNLRLLFSKGDDVVPVSHARKYQAGLKQAKIVIYPHIKGHFLVSEFPQIVKMIKDDVRNRKGG